MNKYIIFETNGTTVRVGDETEMNGATVRVGDGTEMNGTTVSEEDGKEMNGTTVREGDGTEMNGTTIRVGDGMEMNGTTIRVTVHLLNKIRIRNAYHDHSSKYRSLFVRTDLVFPVGRIRSFMW